MHHHAWRWGLFDGTGTHMFSTTGGILMGIVFLIVVGILIYLIVSRSRDRQEFIQYHAGMRNGNTEKNDSLHILKERYAKGELTDEEFEHMKKNLS